jgi:3'-5' exoribonuclease
MKSPYVRDLAPDQPVNGTFLVTHKEVRQKKSGDPYLSLTLADRTGDIDAKMWDNASEVMDTFGRDSFVRVKGQMQVFQNRPQLTVHTLHPVTDADVDAHVDIADYLPASERDREEMFRELQSWIASMTDPHLKTLLENIFANEETARAFRTAPAAKSVHHNWIGGLLEHVLSLCQLAKFTAAHYEGIDFDLLLAGVILHDVGKVTELGYARSFQYTTVGQLLGHISIGQRMVEEQIRTIPGFPPKKGDLLLHMILSHHGELEYGSPKVPVFPEALLLHHLDNMDSKMECMRALIARDPQIEGVWTGYSAPLERSVLKKQKFLEDAPEQARAPQPAVPARSGEQRGNARREPPASPFADKLRDALGPRS